MFVAWLANPLLRYIYDIGYKFKKSYHGEINSSNDMRHIADTTNSTIKLNIRPVVGNALAFPSTNIDTKRKSISALHP